MTSKPRAFWPYELPREAGEVAGPALSPALLAEETEHGVTRDVAWAYAEAMPQLIEASQMGGVLPLAFHRGALRAVALTNPIDVSSLWHVQTKSPEVCRAMGPHVPSFSVQGRDCLDALLQHGTGVREVVVTHCPPFAVEAPFRVQFADTRWVEAFVAEHFLPVVALDLSVWLCWDRDLHAPCIVQDHDTVVAGRWGPRDVVPEAAPPPWAEPSARTVDGAGWAASMLDNRRRRSRRVVAADPAAGWFINQVDDSDLYLDALLAAWRSGAPLHQVATTSHGGSGVHLRFERGAARFAWLGLERVLRVRGPALEQLTTDHTLARDLREHALQLPAEQAGDLSRFSNVVTRTLPQSPLEEASCAVEPGDRFVLLDMTAQQHLERAAGGPELLAQRLSQGTPHVATQWAREVLLRAADARPVVVIDEGATVAMRHLPAPSPELPEPTVRDLIERPHEFHGRRVRLRGALRRGMELLTFAGAWFEAAALYDYGTWIVEVDGVWHHDGAGSGYGHLNNFPSELVGRARFVPPEPVRAVAPDRIRFARRYVPLSSEVVLERRLMGWTMNGRWLTRLGSDARFPEPSNGPERCRAQVKFFVDAFGAIGLFDWTLLDAEPLTPERAEPSAPGPKGRYVEVEGLLTASDGHPMLDGVLAVCVPSKTRSPERHTMPTAQQVDRYRSVLGDGRRVTVRGEMGHSALLALSIRDAHGELEP